MNLKSIRCAAVLIVAVMAMQAQAQTTRRPAAAPALIKPGMWEITVVSETPGSNTRRSVVSRSCFTGEDVASVERLLPRQRESGMQCDTRDVKPTAQGATWQVSCTAKGVSLTGPAKLSFASGGYVGEAELESRKPGTKATKVGQKISGKLIGECK